MTSTYEGSSSYGEIKADAVVPAAKKRSPTQIGTFMRCRRRWALSRIYGSRAGASAQQGLRLHGHREAWLLKASLPDDERDRALVESGIPHLPPPGSVLVETDFEIDRGFVKVGGRRDFVRPPLDGFVALTGDHKFTSNLAYALDEERLRTDPQGVIYAAAGMLEYGQDEHDLLWVYTCTKQPYKSRPVHLTVIYDDVAREMDVLDTVMQTMDTYTGQPPSAVPPNLEACGDFGGCSYMFECGLTAHERLGFIMSAEETLARLRAQKAAAGGAAVAVEPAPVEAPAASQVAPQVASTAGPTNVGPSQLEIMRAAAKARQAPAAVTTPAPANVQSAPASVAAATPTITGGAPDSRRERFAMSALSGLLANPANSGASLERMIEGAIEYADAMIRALDGKA